MKMLSVEEAKDQLAKLLDEAERGEEIAFTRNGSVVARLRPEPPARAPFKPNPEAVREFLEDLERGLPIDAGTWTREELYEDRINKLS